MKTILFVCSGNIFRSLTAELSAKRYISENNIEAVQVRSVGTIVPSEYVRPVVIAALKEHGLDSSSHRPTKFSLESVSGDTTIILMGLDHQKHLAESFIIQSQLFNQVAGVSDSPVLDVHEVLPAEHLHSEKGTEYIRADHSRLQDRHILLAERPRFEGGPEAAETGLSPESSRSLCVNEGGSSQGLL